MDAAAGGDPAIRDRGGAGRDDAWVVCAEDWAPDYEPPATFELDGTDAVEPAEDATGLVAPPPTDVGSVPLAFVDGTRRVELGLVQQHRDGRALRGLAGAYAVGAALCVPGQPGHFGGLRFARMAIWTGGRTGDLGPVHGYEWASLSLAVDDPDAPLQALQNLMRDAEAHLAGELAGLGWQVILDGPLSRVRSLRAPIAGYSKTHRRQLLPDELHRRLPTLPVGRRSPLWALGADRYTCYVRVGTPTAIGTSWSGVTRVEFPAYAGLAAAVTAADRLAATLPFFAGRPHVDPRAPANLQPVRALEQRLGRLLGPRAGASSAARAAVARVRGGASPLAGVLP